MQIDNASYTVTAPDLMLAEYGINILIISSNEKMVEDTKLLFEKYIQSSIVFNVQQSKTNESNMAWVYYISRSTDFILIDLDTCEWLDICIALTKQLEEEKFIVFWGGQEKKSAVKLISALGRYFIVDNVDSLDKLIRQEIVSHALGED